MQNPFVKASTSVAFDSKAIKINNSIANQANTMKLFQRFLVE